MYTGDPIEINHVDFQEEKTKGLAEVDIPVAMLEGQISNAKSKEEKARLEEELTLLKKVSLESFCF